MAWFYTVLLAGGSVGILGWALMLTRRVFRDELLTGADVVGPDGVGGDAR